MESFSSFLKSCREKRGIRLEEIASITKIHLHSLEMMESGRWSELPPEPFIRGFIGAYAKYVGIDPKDAMTRYREETGALTTPQPILTPQNSPSPHALQDPNEFIGHAFALPVGRIAAGFVGVVGASLVIGLISLGKKSTPTVAENAAPVSSSQFPEPPGVPPGAVPAAPTAANADTRSVAVSPGGNVRAPESIAPPVVVSEFPHEVTVETKDRSWVKVVIDGQDPVESYLGENQTVKYQAKSKIKVTLGNSVGAKVLYNGQPNEGKKFTGTVRYFKFPATARFPQDVAPKPAPLTEAAATTETSDVHSPE